MHAMVLRVTQVDKAKQDPRRSPMAVGLGRSWLGMGGRSSPKEEEGKKRDRSAW